MVRSFDDVRDLGTMARHDFRVRPMTKAASEAFSRRYRPKFVAVKAVPVVVASRAML